MNLQKAFRRISWRFSNGTFTPNQNDVDALKFIADWVNREKEESINRNRHFGKLAVYCLMREIEFFDNIHFAERKLHDVLENPLEYWYDRYRLLRIMRDFKESKEILGIDEFPAIWDKLKDSDGKVDIDAKNQVLSDNYRMIEDNREVLKKSLDSWNQSEINKMLNHFITELLNEYGNKP